LDGVAGQPVGELTHRTRAGRELAHELRLGRRQLELGHPRAEVASHPLGQRQEGLHQRVGPREILLIGHDRNILHRDEG
jgi:hypothetical protein